MRAIKYLLLLASTIFLVGCTQNQVVINQNVSDPHVVIENPSIYEWLQFDDINYVTRNDGLMEVEAKFRNFTTNNKVLAYKIDWEDENGFVQKTLLSKWTITQVEERRNLIIHGISPSTKVKNFKIRIQEPTKDDNLRKDSYHYNYQGQ